MSTFSNNDYFTYYPHLIINEIGHFSFTVEQEGLGTAVENVVHATTQRITDFVTSSEGHRAIAQWAIGFGIGLGLHKIYGPLTERIVHMLGMSTIPPDPFFGSIGLSHFLLGPFICIVGPMIEEKLFRGDLQGMLTEQLESFYIDKLGLSEETAHLAARVTSVFFTSLIFGLAHFSNALIFWCNPIVFLPQVVAATLMGLAFGLAKECTGELHMPIGMHMGNNFIAWAQYI